MAAVVRYLIRGSFSTSSKNAFSITRHRSLLNIAYPINEFWQHRTTTPDPEAAIPLQQPVPDDVPAQTHRIPTPRERHRDPLFRSVPRSRNAVFTPRTAPSGEPANPETQTARAPGHCISTWNSWSMGPHGVRVQSDSSPQVVFHIFHRTRTRLGSSRLRHKTGEWPPCALLPL